MYTGLLHLHSILRYAVLILLIIVPIITLIGWLGKRPFTKGNRKMVFWLMTLSQVQMVVGLSLYFVSPKVHFGGNSMSDGLTRYWTVEHITANLLAVLFLTLAHSLSKRAATDEARHRKAATWSILGLITLIVSLTMSQYAPGLLNSTMMNR